MALGTTGLLIFPQCSFQTGSANWRVFTSEEADLMDAIVEQIIPTDEWMGAKDAGVTNYIDKQLASHLSRFKETYKKGLKAIRLTCKEVYCAEYCIYFLLAPAAHLKMMMNGSHFEYAFAVRQLEIAYLNHVRHRFDNINEADKQEYERTVESVGDCNHKAAEEH